MTERTLVQAAQAGRPEATDQLVERYYPRVYSFVSTLKGADAEDLTQEVFARALGALPRFNGEYQFGAWLLQIARNVCIDEARRQVRRPQPTDPIDLVELEPAAQPDRVWESVSSQIAVTTVHRALARLPKRQRTVLVLRELEGMSYADIAIALRVSTRAVEISLSRARKRLRLELTRLDLVEEERAACRRATSMIAADPEALSQEEVMAHLRSCAICQATARRRRPREVLHGMLVLLAVGGAQVGELLRRQLVWAHRLIETVMVSPATGTLSPLSRLAEMGATVAVATAVSVGSLGGPSAAQPIVVPDPPAVASVAVPDSVPAPPVLPAQTVQPAQANVAGSSGSAGAAHSVAGGGPCPAGAGAHTVGIQSGAQPASPTTSSLLAPGPGSGNLLSELLDPVSSLSPVLCDSLSALGGALTGLGNGLQSATRSLGGTKPSGGSGQSSGAAPDTGQQLLDGLFGRNRSGR